MITSLRKELVKIIKQLRGAENMFNYRTTFANQLFLFYCLCGKLFFTNQVHKSFKYIWLFYHMGSLLIGYVVVGMFFLYDTKRDTLLQLYLISVTATSTFMGAILPLILYHYRENIENAVQTIDDILAQKSNSLSSTSSTTFSVNDTIYEKLNLRRNVIMPIVITSICGIVFSTVCLLDVIMFYEDEKVKNYAYYLYPFSNIEKYGTMKVFLIVTFFSYSLQLVLCLEALAILAFLLMWNAVCHFQLLFIRDELNHHSAEFATIIETRTGYNMTEQMAFRFRTILIHKIREFQQIKRLIENLRVVFELFCSVGIPVTVIGTIVQLHSAVSENLPFAVKIKGIWNMLALIYPTLLFCWIGQTMENSITDLSFSVYSSPWYWNVNIRKDVYVFLCQSQVSLNLMATKVLPMLLRTFARISHFVLSTVNFLHQVKIKQLDKYGG